MGALRKIQHLNTSLSSLHFDYITAIRTILQSLPIQIDFHHVKGHADDSTPLQDLSTIERMNVTADLLAKEFNSLPAQDSELDQLSILNEIGPIKVPEGQKFTKISSKFRSTLYDALTKKPTEDYWMKKMKIDNSLHSSLDWQLMGQAFETINVEKQKEVVKWNSEFCGTSKNLKIWKEQTHQKCPICGFDGENTEHILKCPHPEATSVWGKSLRTLEEWLTQQSTAPDLIKIIIDNLRAWRVNRPSVEYSGSLPHLHTALRRQNSIGWSPFIRGFVNIEWKEVQRRYLQQLNSQKSHRRWLKMLIIKLWQISWDMWRFRNSILHSQSTTSTTNFSFLLTTEILKELSHGSRLLPPSCRYLFQKSQSTLLKSTLNNKKLWLTNVWAARDSYTPADIITQNRNTIVQSYVVAWKKKLK